MPNSMPKHFDGVVFTKDINGREGVHFRFNKPSIGPEDSIAVGHVYEEDLIKRLRQKQAFVQASHVEVQGDYVNVRFTRFAYSTTVESAIRAVRDDLNQEKAALLAEDRHEVISVPVAYFEHHDPQYHDGPKHPTTRIVAEGMPRARAAATYQS